MLSYWYLCKKKGYYVVFFQKSSKTNKENIFFFNNKNLISKISLECTGEPILEIFKKNKEQKQVRLYLNENKAHEFFYF